MNSLQYGDISVFGSNLTWGPAHFDTVYDFNAPVTILTSYLCSSTSPLHFHIDFPNPAYMHRQSLPEVLRK